MTSPGSIDFDSLFRAYRWRAIPHCPDCYLLERDEAARALDTLVPDAGAEARRSSPCARDPFVVIRLPTAGGLITYLKSDGRLLHTLNTEDGLYRATGTCPADAIAPGGTICRPAAGECDGFDADWVDYVFFYETVCRLGVRGRRSL